MTYYLQLSFSCTNVTRAAWIYHFYGLQLDTFILRIPQLLKQDGAYETNTVCAGQRASKRKDVTMHDVNFSL